MAWHIEFSNAAVKALKKIDQVAAQRILYFLHERIESADDPRTLGNPLQGEKRTYWRYRVSDYRLICYIHDEAVRVLVVRIGYRKDAYR